MQIITDTRPRRIARRHGGRFMDIYLHIGAHRTATTSFQHYMRQNAAQLRDSRVAFWGPLRTRGGLFDGLFRDGTPSPDMARRRIDRALRLTEGAGITRLVVSEENLAGRPARNLRTARLYPDIAARMARVARAFDGRLTRLAMTVRPQHEYWPSAIAFAVQRGHPLPDAVQLDRIATDGRGWRDVVSDAAAATGADLRVLRHHSAPAATLRAMIGDDVALPEKHGDLHLNAAPCRTALRAGLSARGVPGAIIPTGEGRWQPFDTDQRDRLHEAWLDDEFWLAAHAAGHTPDDTLAGQGLWTTIQPGSAGHTPPPGRLGRGHGNDIEERLVGTR